MFADIIVDIKHEKLDRIFQYRIPEWLKEELNVGMEVVIPFGKGNRQTKGYVVGISETCDYDLSKVKEIEDISRNSVEIEAKLIALAAWMKEHYGGTMIQALKTVLPIKQKENAKIKKYVRLLLGKERAEAQLHYYQQKNQKARARLLEALLEDPVIEYELITKKLNITRSVVNALEEQQVAVLESEQVFRNPVKEKEQRAKTLVFTAEQEHAIECFWQEYSRDVRAAYLLYGVTGSGKTEVYIEMIRRVVSEGKQAIVLIPEIALTYQTVMRFYRRFGNRVSILNSRMSAGERYDQLMRAKAGEIDVMIGPRSALFTPFPELGLIVIDEEHETTYKSEQIPRYHARETAIERANLEHASVVLGSATPSLEAMYRSKNGMQKMASVYVADLRQELKEGNRSILSRHLQELMEDRLEKQEQIMLFLNRRGYAGFLSCRECGHVVKCPHCDVSLSYHRNGKMVCHYCGYEIPMPKTCPACGSRYISGFKAGTQKIEMIVKERFPQARVLRMDMDTTRNKEGYEQILSAFANQEADILIGTQMIVKGHDFPNVTLVGVLAADLSLYVSDYHAAERTFQLLTQAAGRAGRGSEPGEVVIQTYQPDHYSVQAAKEQDYEAFYEQEMEYRRMLLYPPVWNMLVILCASKQEQTAYDSAKLLVQEIDTWQENIKAAMERVGEDFKKKRVFPVGPADPAVAKVNDIYKKVIYIKTKDYQTLVELKDRLEHYMRDNKAFKDTVVQFDFNPMSGF